MRKTLSYVIGVSLLFIIGCGAAMTFDKAGIEQVKTVAVVMYTVPDTIEYRDDPKSSGGGLTLSAIAKEAAKEVSKGKGEFAATVSLKTFVDTLNQQGLPFKVMSVEDMMANSAFTSLYIPREEKKEDSGMASMAMGLLGGGSGPMGVGPENINAFGLVESWGSGVALTGAEGEMDYIKKAIAALNVDAAIVINDFGYSFSCQACVGTAGIMNGSGSTSSAFHATIVSKDGVPLANIKQWFGATSAGAVMVSSMVNPLQHESLFKRHGEKTAELFVEEFQAAMTKVEE